MVAAGWAGILAANEGKVEKDAVDEDGGSLAAQRRQISFEADVDRSRTRVDNAMAFIVDAADVAQADYRRVAERATNSARHSSHAARP